MFIVNRPSTFRRFFTSSSNPSSFTSNRQGWTATPALLCLLAVGCGSVHDADPASEDLDGIPELAAVQMQLTEATIEEGAATEADSVEPDEMADGVEPDAMADDLDLAEVPEDAAADLVGGQRAIRQLNEALRAFLKPIVHLVRTTQPERQVGATRIWGPVTRGNVEYRLAVRSATAGRFSWRLDARAVTGDGKYQRIALGKSTRDGAVRRGRGALGVDLDALRTLDAKVAFRGRVLLGFAHGEAGTTVGYAVRGFAPDAETSPIDAQLRGVHLKGGSNRVRLAYRGDVAGSDSDAQELVLARLRHQRGAGGRSDVLVTGGDVPEGQVWVRSQCWNQRLTEIYTEVQLCPLELPVDLSACVVLEVEGAVTACDGALRDPELPPVDPEAPAPDPKDPNDDVEIPTDLDVLTDPEM